MPKSFPPLVAPHTRILIIGSMPGRVSLAAGQYYAHPRNQFWRIIFDVFEAGRPPKDYTDKQAVILSHGLGLWDTLSSCRRTGSADSQITRPTANCFPALFQQFPHIHTLLFNGAAAFAYYKRAFGVPSCRFFRLPSTSPAYASLSYEEKKACWQIALTSPH